MYPPFLSPLWSSYNSYRGDSPWSHAPSAMTERNFKGIYTNTTDVSKIIDYFHTKPCTQQSLFTFPSNWEPLLTQVNHKTKQIITTITGPCNPSDHRRTNAGP
ncbi:hypothetical protein KUCAC02_007087 [Chaenocephalus aceratus]|nr:hypothetical protein KUCAC02_007087 [Chaenocephalus aceratus]